MTDSEFQIVLASRLSKTKAVLQSKGKEYGRGDRLHNFKRAGLALNCTPERACVSFWMKHVVSILDIVDDIDRGILPSEELLSEKCGDGINYLILLEALILDRRAKDL